VKKLGEAKEMQMQQEVRGTLQSENDFNCLHKYVCMFGRLNVISASKFQLNLIYGIYTVH
jgi:hypothetical protein